MSILEFKDVEFTVGDKTILEGISLSIEEGEFVSIMGPSGSGKSTLLKLASDLSSPTKGQMLYKGKDFLEYPPTELRQEIRMCFQTPYLFGDTVKENLVFPFQVQRQEPDEKRICRLLHEFEMSDDFLDKEVSTLSGGEKQRIALIRSLIYEPKVLLLDEVTSALDVENTRIVEEAIQRRNERGVTILWITHNPQQSDRLADRRIVIEDGRIVKEEVLR